MTRDSEHERILVIDRQEYWRELSVRTLEEAGFSVRALDNYDYPPSDGHAQNEIPDLVILGCSSIGPDERRLINRVLERRYHLLVLCASLPWRVMRALFLAGADDVTSKPYDPDRLISTVKQALESMLPRDSYHAAEQEGVT